MAAARPATPAPMTRTSAVWSHLIWGLASAAVAPVSAAAPTPAAAPFDRKDLRLSASGAPPLSLRSCVPIAFLPYGRLYLPAILTLWAAGSRQHLDAAPARVPMGPAWLDISLLSSLPESCSAPVRPGRITAATRSETRAGGPFRRTRSSAKSTAHRIGTGRPGSSTEPSLSCRSATTSTKSATIVCAPTRSLRERPRNGSASVGSMPPARVSRSRPMRGHVHQDSAHASPRGRTESVAHSAFPYSIFKQLTGLMKLSWVKRISALVHALGQGAPSFLFLPSPSKIEGDGAPQGAWSGFRQTGPGVRSSRAGPERRALGVKRHARALRRTNAASLPLGL